MAQWRRVLRLTTALRSRVNRVYHQHKVPRDIRSCFCDWVEEQDWDSAAADEATAKIIFQTLLLKLDERIKESLYNNLSLEGPDFSVLKDHLMNLFEHCPMDMAERLSQCLKEEKMILDSLDVEQSYSHATSQQTQTDLEDMITRNTNLLEKTGEELKVLEKLEGMYKVWESQVKQMNGRVNSQMQKQLLLQGNSISSKKQELVAEVESSVKLAHQIVQTLVCVELPEWKRSQQMACIGNPVKTSLNQLEKWFSAVGEMLLQILQQLRKLQNNNIAVLSELLQQTCTSLNHLLKNALVVEEQPVTSSQPHRPLVLRTKVAFTVKLRFLANLAIFSKEGCEIKAEFDKDVEEVETIKGFRQFQFKCKSSKIMNAVKDNGSLVTEWDMEIVKKEANTKRSNNTPIRVTEELHIIKFSTELDIAGEKYEVETSTLPLVVVSTSTQSPSAWASVMWFNLLPQPTSLSVFKDPPPLSWGALSQALSWQFISAGDRELNPDQLSELKPKITDDPDDLVTWSKFSHKDGPWMWIDGILDLVEKHLKNHWRDGSIMGFINRDKARFLLRNQQNGNFLLRFSESNKEGAISLSLVKHSKKKASVHDIDPFTKKDLSSKSLADIIKDYTEKGSSSNPLLYLFPDVPKDLAFGRYYSTPVFPPIITKPYLRWKFVCQADFSYPTPPPSPPELSQSDLSQDLMDFIDTSGLLQQDSFDESELFPLVHLYNADNNNMDISENCEMSAVGYRDG